MAAGAGRIEPTQVSRRERRLGQFGVTFKTRRISLVALELWFSACAEISLGSGMWHAPMQSSTRLDGAAVAVRCGLMAGVGLGDAVADVTGSAVNCSVAAGAGLGVAVETIGGVTVGVEAA